MSGKKLSSISASNQRQLTMANPTAYLLGFGGTTAQHRNTNLPHSAPPQPHAADTGS